MSGCSEKIDSFDEYVQLARLNERQQNYPAAVQAYSKALTLVPNDPTTWYDRGVAQLASDRAELAIADYARAVELDPDFAIAWNNLGAAQLIVGQFSAAIDSCNQAIDINPADPLPWRNRGLAHHRFGMQQQSIVDLTQADRLEPGDPFTLLSRGISFLDNGQMQLAAVDFTSCLAIDDSEPLPWLKRAIVRYRLGDQDGAASDIAEAKSRGAQIDVTPAGLSLQHLVPLPEVVEKHLTVAGYEKTDLGWRKSDEPVHVIAKVLLGDSVSFRQVELAFLDGSTEKVLVVFEPTADGIRVVSMLEDWAPNAAEMRPTELSLPVR
jgi:Flp pilus assembly protein TadD